MKITSAGLNPEAAYSGSISRNDGEGRNARFQRSLQECLPESCYRDFARYSVGASLDGNHIFLTVVIGPILQKYGGRVTQRAHNSARAAFAQRQTNGCKCRRRTPEHPVTLEITPSLCNYTSTRLNFELKFTRVEYEKGRSTRLSRSAQESIGNLLHASDACRIDCRDSPPNFNGQLPRCILSQPFFDP